LAGGQPSTLACGMEALIGVGAGGGSVFWQSYGLFQPDCQWQGTFVVGELPRTGGTPRVLSVGEWSTLTHRDFTVAGGTVYWTGGAAGGGALFQVPAAGGSTTAVALFGEAYP